MRFPFEGRPADAGQSGGQGPRLPFWQPRALVQGRRRRVRTVEVR